ncbi:adenylate isopentenyltransferase 5, chloroplastic-like [Apium graveolens]|uniref:adenylate isopentenyltransferase 5, chloroplastic-like n=1 Tax=Apium graveolens TaxID=4045 RepID=UPI003D792CE2
MRISISALASIVKCHRLPIIAGGSNSYIEALTDKGWWKRLDNISSPNLKGIRRTIGVSEFDYYFRVEAIHKVKINSCRLACVQLEKII